MKKVLSVLLASVLMLMATMAWARTFTTPVIDGIITVSDPETDWDVCEDFVTMSFDGADYTLWITWDQLTGVYVGIDRDVNPNNRFLGDGSADISLYVGIDTDQAPGSGALNDGYMTVSFSPYSNHLPEYCFYFTGGAGWYEWSQWNQLGGYWDWKGWRNDGTYYGWNNDVNIDDEVRILWSDIGNPQGIAMYVWITNEAYDPWPPIVRAAWPEENPIGTFPTFFWAYEFYYGHYYCAPGVPAYCYQPACNICPNLTDHSVPVTLSSFVATGRADAIEVSWISQSEVNALAYRLLRSESESGEYAEVFQCQAMGNAETAQDYLFVDRQVDVGQTYYYQLVDVDNQGNERFHGPVFAAAGVSVPGAYSLLPNYPNPFNPSTAIGYQVPEAGHVTIAVYNVLGQEIRTLVDAHQEAGTYTVMWDGQDQSDHHLNSGVYFCIMKSGSFSQTRKMVLMR